MKKCEDCGGMYDEALEDMVNICPDCAEEYTGRCTHCDGCYRPESMFSKNLCSFCHDEAVEAHKTEDDESWRLKEVK